LSLSLRANKPVRGAARPTPTSARNAALVSTVELAKRVVDQEARIAKLEALVEQLFNRE
jgi:hypothetical protein